MQTIEKGIDTIVPEGGLKSKLELGRSLNIKLGFDPTAPDLHLGHAVVLRKLREFQDAGHNIIVIIGDFTARIGDPTGRNITRPPLTVEQVKSNAETYVAQLSKILDIQKIQIRFNSEWLEKMGFADVIKLISHMTLGQMMQRNDFRERYESGKPIALHEMLYPVMQGYDSVVIDADVEIGGTDQLFNCMVGRSLQDNLGSKARQIVVCMPLLRGTDGREKMSKSKDNYIGLTDDPDNMFGKVMSIPDELIAEYVDLGTSLSEQEKEALKEGLEKLTIHPMDIKKAIASNIVRIYHGEAASQSSQLAFEQRVQQKVFKEADYQEFLFEQVGLNSNSSLLDACQALEPNKSRSEFRRLAEGGGVKVNGEKLTDLNKKVSDYGENFKLQVGKRDLYNLKKTVNS